MHLTYLDNITDPALLFSFAVFCALSFFLSLIITFAGQHFFNQRAQQDLFAIQSAHERFVPRLGGIAVFLALLVFVWILNSDFLMQALIIKLNIDLLNLLILSALPIFLVGLLEDLGYFIVPLRRLLASIASGVLVVFSSKVWVASIGIPAVDLFLSFSLLGIIFTLVATAGVVHSFNLIDGLNGLAGFTGISTAVALSFIAFEANHFEILRFLFIFSACILGFLLLNFPAGKIFLGDAGAYLIGHLLVWSAIVLVNHSSQVSPFAILLIFFWPVADTCLAIWRRWKQKKRADQPDRLHFHQLVMRFLEIRFFGRTQRQLVNPLATIILVPFIVLPQMIGVLFWNNFLASVWLTVIMTALFIISYVTGISMVKRVR